MSGNRLADAIRRIVGYDSTKSTLEAALKRAKIEGARGIGFLNPDNASAGSTSGKAGSGGKQLGTTKPADGVVKSNVGNKPAAETGGNEVNPRDPNRSVHSFTQGSYPADEVINEKVTLKMADDFIAGIGGLTNAAAGGGTLNELTGIYDCESEKEIEVRFDGVYKPPEGWPDSNTPPPNQEWILGQSWYRFDGGVSCTLISPSMGESASAAVANQLAATTGDTTITSEGFGSAPGCASPSGPVYVVSGTNSLFGAFTWYFVRLGCTPGVTAYCPTEAPEIFWPEDNKMQLLWDGTGQFKFNEREPEADRIPRLTDNQHSVLDFCYGDGSTGRLEPTGNGGYMMYQTSGGNATGIIKIFGANNKVIGYTDVAGKASFMPGGSFAGD